MTGLMDDYSDAVLLEGDSPLVSADLLVYVAPASGGPLLVRRTARTTVVGVVDTDARAVIAVLAQPEVLLVFGAIVVATSRARRLDRMGQVPVGTSYVTPSGLAKDTSLSRAVIERAAATARGCGTAGGPAR
jgi:hypothetical protein